MNQRSDNSLSEMQYDSGEVGSNVLDAILSLCGQKFISSLERYQVIDLRLVSTQVKARTDKYIIEAYPRKLFFSVSSSFYGLQKLDLRHLVRDEDHKHSQAVISRLIRNNLLQSLVELRADFSDIQENILHNTTKHLTKLTTLVLENVVTDNELWLPAEKQYFQQFIKQNQLQTLKISGKMEPQVSLITSINGNIRELDLTNTHFTSSSLDNINCLRQLQVLKLCGVQNFTPSHLQSIALLTQLQSLDLCRNKLADIQLSTLLPLKQLTYLSLAKCPSIGNNSLPPLVGLPQLRHLDVSHTRVTSPTGICHLTQHPNCPPIQHLQLTACLLTFPSGLSALADFPHLESLSFTYPPYLDRQNGATNTVTGLEGMQLRQLSVDCRDQRSDPIPYFPLNQYQGLKSLQLVRVRFDAQYASMIGQLAQLESLGIQQSDIWPSTENASVTWSTLGLLKHVSFIGNTVGPQQLALALSPPALTWLDLRGSALWLGYNELTASVREHATLRGVNISIPNNQLILDSTIPRDLQFYMKQYKVDEYSGLFPDGVVWPEHENHIDKEYVPKPPGLAHRA